MENIPNGYRTHCGDGNPNHYHIQRLKLSVHGYSRRWAQTWHNELGARAMKRRIAVILV